MRAHRRISMKHNLKGYPTLKSMLAEPSFSILSSRESVTGVMRQFGRRCYIFGHAEPMSSGQLRMAQILSCPKVGLHAGQPAYMKATSQCDATLRWINNGHFLAQEEVPTKSRITLVTSSRRTSQKLALIIMIYHELSSIIMIYHKKYIMTYDDEGYHDINIYKPWKKPPSSSSTVPLSFFFFRPIVVAGSRTMAVVMRYATGRARSAGSLTWTDCASDLGGPDGFGPENVGLIFLCNIIYISIVVWILIIPYILWSSRYGYVWKCWVYSQW